MARGLKRSLIKGQTKPADTEAPAPQEATPEPTETQAPPAFRRATGGAGSAWKAGALAQTQAGLDEAREDLAKAILAGDQVIEIDADMISDPIGSDRRADWKAQEEFKSLLESMREHGQDMPILVWPEDEKWAPDEIDPKNLERVQFLLLAGRRRCEAAKELGRPVRAIIASQEGRGSAETLFNMLVLRFRENEERQDLSAFERLVSIGQMYEELKSSSKNKVTAKSFAERLAVHESIVSRARAVFKAKDEILNAFKNVYEMSFHDLQAVVSDKASEGKSAAKKPAKPKKITVRQKIGSRVLAMSTQGGKLSVSASGLAVDKETLEGLGEVIANYLSEKGVAK